MTHIDGVLVTAAARLGRLRPNHGELWLLDHGVLYRALGLRRTAAQLRKEPGARVPAATVDPAQRPRGRFAAVELERIAAASGANRWIPHDALVSARLRRRLSVSKLWLELHDGDEVVLSWPRRERATPMVVEQLGEWLGERLDAR